MRTIPGMTLGLLLLVVATSSRAALPVHVWSQRFGGASLDRGHTVKVDASGNVIASGMFQLTANFGGGDLVSAGSTDIFLAKYDANGAHLWSKGIGGTGADWGVVAAVDGSGNVVLTGLFGSAVDFGGGPLVSAGGNDIFLVKYDANGAHLWSQRFGDTGDDTGWDVALDGAGNVVAVGWFSGTIDLGGGPLVSAGGLDVVVAKFDPSGAHVWSQRFGAAFQDQGISAKVDGAGNVILIGQFAQTVDFGGGALVSAGSTDIFLAKYDASGSYQWSQRFGDAGADQPACVEVGDDGNIVMAAIFLGTVDFGGGSLASAGDNDIVLAKYDPSGAHLWSRRFGDTGNDIGQTVALDGAGNIAVAGLFTGTVDFGGGPLAGAGNEDIFVAKYDASGTHLWSQAFGGTGQDNGIGVAMTDSGEVLATGFFNGTVDFGGGDLESAGSGDVFLAKFSDQSIVPVLISRFDARPRARGIDLTWGLSSDEPLDAFTLYRARGESAPTMIAHGDAQATRSYTDTSVDPGETYHYDLVIRAAGGSEFRSPTVTVTMPEAVTSLAQNFPNPFNPVTTIEYTISARTAVAIEIFDVSGRRVRVLEQGPREAGTYDVEWDGHDAANRPVGSGVYFYRLAGIKGADTHRMVLLK